MVHGVPTLPIRAMGVRNAVVMTTSVGRFVRRLSRALRRGREARKAILVVAVVMVEGVQRS